MSDAIVVVAIVTATLLLVLPMLLGNKSNRDLLADRLDALDTDGLIFEPTAAEGAFVEGQLDTILAEHADEVRQLDKPYDQILAEVVEENPFVGPLVSRFDQTVAKARHHRRCEQHARKLLERNLRLKQFIAETRHLIRQAKGE